MMRDQVEREMFQSEQVTQSTAHCSITRERNSPPSWRSPLSVLRTIRTFTTILWSVRLDTRNIHQYIIIIIIYYLYFTSSWI